MPAARKSSSVKTKQVVLFTFEREGKGSVRYTEDTEGDEVIGKLYLKRPLWDKLGQPDALKVTVETDED